MRTFAFAVLVGAVLAGVALAADTAMPAFKSKDVLYAKINLTADGEKSLILALDKSGSSYDTVHVVPRGFAAGIQTERGKVQRMGSARKSTIGPVSLSAYTKFSDNAAMMPKAITVSYYDYGAMEEKYASMKGVQAEWVVAVATNGAKWEYGFSGRVETAADEGGAQAITLVPKLSLMLTAQQPKDPKKGTGKVAIEAGVAVQAEGKRVSITRNGAQASVGMAITSPDGKSTRKASGPPDKFSFG
jgi:hypothetical protein